MDSSAANTLCCYKENGCPSSDTDSSAYSACHSYHYVNRRCGVHAATYHVLPRRPLRVATSPSRAVCSSGGDSGARVRSGIGLQKTREKHLGASEQAEQLRQSPPRPQVPKVKVKGRGPP